MYLVNLCITLVSLCGLNFENSQPTESLTGEQKDTKQNRSKPIQASQWVRFQRMLRHWETEHAFRGDPRRSTGGPAGRTPGVQYCPHVLTVALSRTRTVIPFYQYTQISPLRNLTPKKWDMNGHLISINLTNHNCMGIPAKKRDMNEIYPLS